MSAVLQPVPLDPEPAGGAAPWAAAEARRMTPHTRCPTLMAPPR